MGVHGLDYLKISEIIGAPYELVGSTPPVSFNCWTLITYLFPHAPTFEPVALKEYVEMFNRGKDELDWDEVDAPSEGDIILLAKNEYYSHAGVLLGKSKLLHAKSKLGVIIEDLNMVKLRYQNIKAYRWR